MRFTCILTCVLFLSIIRLNAQKPITLEDIWVNGTFTAKGVEGFNFTPDGKHYLRQEGKSILEYDLATGQKKRTVFAGEAASNIPDFDSYTFSADGKFILLATSTEAIYRHSNRAQYFIAPCAGGAATEIFPKGKIMHATFSPDATKIAFVFENNLYYYTIANGKTKQITTDGALNRIINGAGDWVYEEEFVLVRAFEWSADSKSLAWVRFDETEVPEFSMETYDVASLYPGVVKFKYPKVGEANAKVTVFIFDTPSANTFQVQTLDPEYIVRIQWTPDHHLSFITLNRLQNHLKLLTTDRNTGVSTTVLEETSPAYVEIHDNLTWLNGGKSFLWTSEKDGYNQLFWYNRNGTLRQKITKDQWDITDFYGMDEAKQVIYYQANANSALDREVYRYDLKKRKHQLLSHRKGTNSAKFSPGFQYFSLSHSSLNTAPQYSLHDQTGKLVRTLEDNNALNTRLSDFHPVQANFFDFKIASGERLNGYIMKPEGAETSNERHPVLMFVYGGPGSQQVVNSWRGANYWWFQHLVQKGYVVACVDNRGTGGRGAAFRQITYGQLGKYETQDQIAAAEWLGKQKYVDRARIGIFGWSYGGYMASRSLFEGGKVFKAAIAVAPVTNWKWYDSVYTERYMGLYNQNAAGYDQNAPIAFAKNMQGAFLLIHGLADDNVHFQHTAELTNELIRQKKQYQTMLYPNKNHSIGGKQTRLHLYTLMTNFLDQNLSKTESF
jgi:dipeptidyl-peptidase 4